MNRSPVASWRRPAPVVRVLMADATRKVWPLTAWATVLCLLVGSALGGALVALLVRR
jgi:hypothetical protein